MFKVFAILLAVVSTAATADPNGTINVIDADTIDVGGVRVRLFGIDAPEMGQPCSANGREWDCGAWATDAVRDRYEGKPATCSQFDTDRYGRVVAQCVVDGHDMGSAIVSSGLAWAYRRYSDVYDLDEKAAAVAERGLWAVSVQMPSAFRATRFADDPPPQQGCTIKGNISGNGRIYHMPGGDGYSRTRINTANGERWFCSPSEAEAAGWRASRR